MNVRDSNTTPQIYCSVLEIMNTIIILCAVLEVLSQKVYLSEAQVDNVNRQQAIQKKFPPDDIESWLNPSDGVLATENTPIYIVSQDPSNIKKFIVTKRDGLMKEALAYLRQYKSYALNNNPAKNTVDGNQNPENLNRKSTMASPPIQMTTSNLSFSYPTIIYPRVLAIVDNELFKNVGYDLREGIIYTLAYWNSVDLYFRNIESPKIRINIPAILIVMCPMFYPKFNALPKKTAGEVLIDFVLSWMKDNKETWPSDSYDMIGLMVSDTLYAGRGETSWAVAGVTRSGVAVAQDWGYFWGNHAMAHEIAHMFGINHDGEINKKCPFSDHYFMTDEVLGPHYYEWSSCSLNELTELLKNNNDPRKLYNKIDVQGEAVPKILPGRLTDLEEQCIRRSGDKTTAVYEEGNCETLTCQAKPGNVNPNYKIRWDLGPIDGTYCGPSKICLQRKCVKIP